MYYQGLLSLIAPSQMMICGTLTLRYLFRIVLSGAVAKGEDFITSGSVTRQGIHITTKGGWETIHYPIKMDWAIVAIAPAPPEGGDTRFSNTPVTIREVHGDSLITTLGGVAGWNAYFIILGIAK